MKRIFTSLLALFLIGFGNQAYGLCCGGLGGYYANGCVDCDGEVNNFYGEILGGYNFFKPNRVKWGGSERRVRYKDIHKGLIISASLGYHFCYGWRVEGEFAFRRNPFKKIHFFGFNFKRHAHLETYSYMANLIWELPIPFWTCPSFRFTPFIGAGIGYDKNKVCGTKRHRLTNFLGFRPEIRKHKDSFAWQVMAGLSFPLLPSIDVSFEYKFHKSPCMWNQSYGIGLVYKFLYQPNY